MNIFDCWATFFGGIGAFIWLLRWPVLIYAGLYAIGAAAFLVNLKVHKDADGQLSVSGRSLSYRIAHPIRYAKGLEGDGIQSICRFYARTFNMLLFVWPLIVLLALIVYGPVLLMLLVSAGGYISLDFSELPIDPPFHFNKVLPIPPVLIIAPLVSLIATLLCFATVVHVVVCYVLPTAAIIAIIVRLVGSLVRRWEAVQDGEKVGLFGEALHAQKQRFCHMINVR